MNKLGHHFKIRKINKGLLNTVWPCRLEKFKFDKIDIYLDGSHNIDGAKKLLSNMIKLHIASFTPAAPKA